VVARGGGGIAGSRLCPRRQRRQPLWSLTGLHVTPAISDACCMTLAPTPDMAETERESGTFPPPPWTFSHRTFFTGCRYWTDLILRLKGQRSRSNGHRTPVNAISPEPEPLKGFERKLTQIFYTLGPRTDWFWRSWVQRSGSQNVFRRRLAYPTDRRFAITLHYIRKLVIVA